MSYVDHAREHLLVNGLLWQLGQEGQERWEACKSSHRFLSFVGKQLIIFTLDSNHKPVLKDRITMSSMGLSSGDGLTSHWTNSHGNLIKIGHVPVEVAPSTFLWHTFGSDLQYIPHKGVYNVRTSMLFKTEHNIGYKHVGPHYMLEYNSFQQEFNL